MSIIRSIIKARCPRCREGEIFTHSLFNFKQISSIYQNCSQCNLRYEKEPGNLYGAMYVSYAFSTGIFFITAFLIYYFFNDPSLNSYLMATTLVTLLLFPFNYRYSKVIFIYLIWKN